MTLESGQRLPGLGWSHYLIDRLESDNAYSPLYRASKVQFNHRYEEQEFYETEQDEWLPVWIRTTGAATSNDSEEIGHRVKLLKYEMDAVLTAGSAWTAEPIDWIEYPENSTETDHAAEQAPSFPTASLVFSMRQGKNLNEALSAWPEVSLSRIRLLTEWLNFLQLLHDREQCLGGIAPDEIIFDQTDHFNVLATDRILPIQQTENLRWFYPPSRFPNGFTAPEIMNSESGYDQRSDLYCWGVLALFAFAGIDLSQRTALAEQPITTEEVEQLTSKLEDHTDQFLLGMKMLAPGRFSNSKKEIVAGWRTAILAALKQSPSNRPASILDLRNVEIPGTPMQKVTEKVKGWFKPVKLKPKRPVND